MKYWLSIKYSDIPIKISSNDAKTVMHGWKFLFTYGSFQVDDKVQDTSQQKQK